MFKFVETIRQSKSEKRVKNYEEYLESAIKECRTEREEDAVNSFMKLVKDYDIKDITDKNLLRMIETTRNHENVDPKSVCFKTRLIFKGSDKEKSASDLMPLIESLFNQ